MSRRADLETVAHQSSTHPGLWLDKFLAGKGEAPEKAMVIRDAANVSVRDGYPGAFKRRLHAFNEAGSPALCFPVKAEGRVAIGLGAKGVVENGITLEHTWGVPILPGSALKGLAAAAARKLVGGEWAADGESYKQLFGTTESSGCVDFLDAWWEPEDGKSGLLPDVTTVHHKDYYAGKNVPPSDFDSPFPVPFCTAKGTFLVVLDGDRVWCEAARKLLELGLEHLGIGAKTNAGYGRMTVGAPIESELTKMQRGLGSRAQKVLVGFQGIQTATPAASELLKLREAGLPEDVLRTTARGLWEKDRKGWATWSKGEKRTEAELDFYREFFPSSPPVAAQAMAAPSTPADPAKERRAVQAFAKPDSQGRPEVFVIGEKKPLKHQVIDDRALRELLKAASPTAPHECIAVYVGGKLKTLESK